MGRFDLNNLLSELGLQRNGAGAAESEGEGDIAHGDLSGAEMGHGDMDGGESAAAHPEADPGADPIPSFDSPDANADERGSKSLEKARNAESKARRAANRARIEEDDDSLELLWSPDVSDDDDGSNRDLGDELLARGVINAEQLDNARAVLRQSPGRTLKAVLIERGVDEEQVQRVVAQIAGLAFERIDAEQGYDGGLLHRLGVEYCKQSQIIPIRRDGRRVVIGTTQPEDVFLLDEVRRKLGNVTVSHVLVCSADIAAIVESKAGDAEEDEKIDEILADIDVDDVDYEAARKSEDNVDFEKEAGESPVIRMVNLIIQKALKDGASDIHIEPGEKRLKVRYRIDGILFEVMNPPPRMHAAILSRLKIMANLDIAERRLPQDGRIRAVVSGRKLDLRVSTLPTVTGEKCVIRILDNRSISVGLDQLGFSEEAISIWRRQIANPHGIILVTGPTGSGKTTTLYSSLREMDTQKLNVSTTEDPVEYHLDGITQVQIHDRIGMSFAAALRSLLRQDPDVVMVGEIRDADTARIAVQAALTGHLVLSTLHTNDAPSSVTRLINIGVEPFLIGAALNAVLAQRLVRKICNQCKNKQKPTEEVGEFLMMQGYSSDTVSYGAGCERCRQTGYAGRLGIYELLVLDDVTRDAIARSPNVTEFRRMCIERGMVTLRQDGMAKVGHGMTTVEEVLRVTEATI